MESVPGLPGSVYKLTVLIPNYADLVRANPDLRTYKFPAQSTIRLQMGTSTGNPPPFSQGGVYISVRP
jgi:hypothetical protein